MKTSIASLLLMLCVVPTASAKPKSEQQLYLEGRTDEAMTACGKYLIATAKDPESIKFEEKYSYGFGKLLTKDWIYIYFSGWGKNTYGATLRHNFVCEVSCKHDQPCSVLELKDNN